MKFGYCPRCNEYKINPQNCGCKLFLCWYEDTKDIPDEANEIYAVDYDEAAETLVKLWSDGEFDTSPVDVFVMLPDDTEQQHFIVTPQIDISYLAEAA